MPATSPEESFLFDEEDGGITVTVAATAEAVEAEFVGRLEAAEDDRSKALKYNCHLRQALRIVFR